MCELSKCPFSSFITGHTAWLVASNNHQNAQDPEIYDFSVASVYEIHLSTRRLLSFEGCTSYIILKVPAVEDRTLYSILKVPAQVGFDCRRHP